jgi:NAD+ kinase
MTTLPGSRTGSTPGSPTRSPDRVERAAVVTHGKPEVIRDAVARLEAVAKDAGVELVADDAAGDGDVDVAIVLGGDGTMLRALQRFLGTGVPVFGVNFGRVGFLTSVHHSELESGVARVLADEHVVVELATIDVAAGAERAVAVNDVVATSATLGRMVELEWHVGGESLGLVACDGVICATPTGSTAYNLSNGGPVLVWGLDAVAVTFVSPHSLHARPLVVPRGRAVEIWNRTLDVATAVLVDGHPLADLGSGESVSIRLGDTPALLAVFPEETFFKRYRETFAS